MANVNNNITIIGNLTKNPEARVTQTGVNVTQFTVAVNSRRGNDDHTVFFNVSAWRQLGENCAKYLAKGSKVAVAGEVDAHAYINKNGDPVAQIDVNADGVAFLNRVEREEEAPAPQAAEDVFENVSMDDCPF